MKLEHFGMAEPGDCRLVFTAGAEELAAAIAQVQAGPDVPQEEDGLLTEAVNRTILGGFSALYEHLMREYHVVPVTDPDFELLAVNRAEGFRAGAQFYALPPLEVGQYTGFVQAVEPHPIRQLTIELEINRHHGDEERAADAAGKAALRRQVARDIWAQRCAGAACPQGAGVAAGRCGNGHPAQTAGGRQLLCRAAAVQPEPTGQRHQL